MHLDRLFAADFEDGTLDQAMMLGLVPLAWSPLGGGRHANPLEPRDKAVAAERESFQ